VSYREDVRSHDEFKRDIKAGAIAEHKILQRWLNVIEKETGSRPKYKNNGCDNSGKYLKDNQVTQDADYEVDGYGLVEIKFSKPKLNNVLHLKVNQVNRILSDKTNILFANGWLCKGNTTFCFITPRDLNIAIKNADKVRWVGFGWKMSYRININQFKWQPLP
jgi:hypothetical protein